MPFIGVTVFEETRATNVLPFAPAVIADGVTLMVSPEAANAGAAAGRLLTVRRAPKVNARDASLNRRTRWIRFTGFLPFVIDGWTSPGRLR
jgi:hypothetical protein